MSRNELRRQPNDAFGFFGAIAPHVPDPTVAFANTAGLIAQAVGCEPEEVRPFLDSRHGRLFADDVAMELATGCDFTAAVGAVIERWQEWRMAGRGRIARNGSFLVGTVQAESYMLR